MSLIKNHQKYLKKLKNFKNCPTRTYTSTKFLELFNKSINIPSGKELDWAKVSHEKYLKVAMGKIEHKAEKETLNKADFAVIKAYAKEHPEDDIEKYNEIYK